jgi:hypothetical protein
VSNAPNIRDRLLSNTGLVLNGGKLYFYEAGTTTPQATYPTEADATAATNANDNPLVAVSTGQFPEYWWTPNTAYRVILKDSLDNTIFDADDLYAVTLDGDELSTHVYETSESPNKTGALGTGASDETTHVQAAIDRAVANSREGVVDLMGRYYRCDSALTMYSGLTLRNGTLDFSNATADQYMIALGTASSSVLLSSNLAPRAGQVVVASASGVSAGDYIHIREVSGANSIEGEICRVIAVSGTTLSIGGPFGTYTTAGAAVFRKITPVTDLRLENLTIIANPAASGTGRVVHIERCVRVDISNCTISGHKDAAIEVRGSVDVQVRGCSINQASGSTASTQMAFRIADSSRDVWVTDCAFSDHRGSRTARIGDITGGTLTSGNSNNVTVRGCSFIGAASSSGVHVADATYAVHIEDCKFLSSLTQNVAIKIEGCETTVSGCHFYGALSTAAIEAPFSTTRTAAARLRVVNNTFDGATRFLSVSLGAVTVDHLEICGNNDSEGAAGADGGMVIEANNASAVIENVVIANNSFGGIDNDGSISVIATTGSCRYVTITGNVAPSIIVTGNATNYIYSAVVSSNTLNLAETAGVAMLLTKVIKSTVNGNAIGGTTLGTGISVLNANDGATSVAISGNTIDPASWSSGVACIKVEDTDAVSITGNVCVGGSLTQGIYVYANATNITSCVVSGNIVYNASTSATDYGIHIRGSAAATAIFRATVTGNTVNTLCRALYFNGDIGGGVISGNVCESGGAINSVVYLNGRATGTVSNVAITGNTIREGVYGIELTNTSGVTWAGNSFTSQSTAAFLRDSSPGDDAGPLYTKTVSITATEIVGSAAGALNHADGVPLVDAVPGYVIEPVTVTVNYTYSTAVYTDGGNTHVMYVGAIAVSAATSMAVLWGNSSSTIRMLLPDDVARYVNLGLMLRCVTAITQPGTAAGSAVIKVTYRLIQV